MLKLKIGNKIAGLAVAAILIATVLMISISANAAGTAITVNSVTRNTDLTNDYSYFDISIDTSIEEVPDGTYPGWCAQRLVLIGNDWPADAMMWDDYDPTHPFQSYDWPQVNWLINEYDAPDDYDFSIMQMSIWGILGYDYTTSEYHPGSVTQGIVNGLITAAGDHDDYMPSAVGDVSVYIIYVSDKVQRTIIEVPYVPEENDGKDDTAWAYGSKDTELWDLTKETKKGEKPLTKKWGWYFLYKAGEGTEADPVERTLYAGAGQNDITKGWDAGEAQIWDDDGVLYVKYALNDEVFISEAHVYAGEDAPTTASPGQFPYNSGDLDFEDEYEFEIDDLGDDWGTLYIAVHGVVWDF